MTQVNLLFPEKNIKLSEKDKPWVDTKLQNLDRQQKREYNKHKKSDKWERLNKVFFGESRSIERILLL